MLLIPGRPSGPPYLHSVYNANQKKLNSPQLELVKSDHKLLFDYFFVEAMSFSLEPPGMIINDSHKFAILKCYYGFNQYRSISRK